jgi:hypothetical protein
VAPVLAAPAPGMKLSFPDESARARGTPQRKRTRDTVEVTTRACQPTAGQCAEFSQRLFPWVAASGRSRDIDNSPPCLGAVSHPPGDTCRSQADRRQSSAQGTEPPATADSRAPIKPGNVAHSAGGRVRDAGPRPRCDRGPKRHSERPLPGRRVTTDRARAPGHFKLRYLASFVTQVPSMQPER